MDRYWLLSNTCYGRWLPGDPRGFVGHVWEHRDAEPPADLRVVHDVPDTPYDEAMPELERAARRRMRGPPVLLTTAHADAALAQFRETAGFRAWSIDAVAVMANHFHIVVGVPGDPEPGKILGDFKSWATRALSRQFGKPASETWWTAQGSKRRLRSEAARQGAIHYVLFEQYAPLLIWSPTRGRNPSAPGERRGVSPPCEVQGS